MSREAPPSVVSCLGCGKHVDRLRAGHVAIIDGEFAYFCNVSCKHSYHDARLAQYPDDVETIAPPAVDARSLPMVPKFASGPEPLSPPATTRVSALLAWTGIAAAALTPATSLFGTAGGHVRVGLTLLVGLCVSGRTLASGSGAPRSVLDVAPPLVALGACMSAEIRGGPQARSLTLFAAALLGGWLAVGLADERVRAGLQRVRDSRKVASSHLGEEDALFVQRLLHFAGVGSPMIALLAAGVVRLNSGSWEVGFAVAAAVLMMLQFRAFLLAARQIIFSVTCKAEDAGILFRDIVSYETLGRVDACAFSTRGVVYVGLPEVTEVHSFGGTTEAKVLQLAGAVAAYADEAVDQGIERALKNRGLVRETVRGVRVGATGAVSALDESAQRVVFGMRPQLVEEKLSVAVADEMATEHEEQSRTVFLLALGERVIGTVVLQSVLRPEVRSAVRTLLDLNVEPILMSEDSADAVAALARGLGITHVRADLATKARANAIRDLVSGGRTVAVIGLSKRDAEPMLAAHAAIALDAAASAAGSTPYAATLATSDMRVAVQAISLPRRLHDQLRRALAISIVPQLVALALATFDLAPLVFVPLAALAGLGAALLYSGRPREAGRG